MNELFFRHSSSKTRVTATPSVWLHNDYARTTHRTRALLYRSRVTNLPLTDAQGAPRLTFLATLCGSRTCPTIYRTDRDTYVVQGYSVTGESAGLDLPPGEQLVEIPIGLLAEAMKAAAQHD